MISPTFFTKLVEFVSHFLLYLGSFLFCFMCFLFLIKVKVRSGSDVFLWMCRWEMNRRGGFLVILVEIVGGILCGERM